MKLAIIGTSLIADSFMDALQHIDDITVKVVCSRDIKNALKFSEKYNIKHAVDHFEDILNYEVDGVYIATPNSLHFEQASFFLSNSIPVLLEKPLASNVDEVEKLIQTAIENKTLLMEAIIPIHTDNFKAIQDNLDKIQPIRRAVLSMNQYSSRYDAYKEGQTPRIFDPEYAAGSIMDIGIYPLYNAICLFNNPNYIFANAHLLDSKVDGSGSIVLTYDEMEIIILHSKVNNGIAPSEIMGENGNITIDNMGRPQEVTLYLHDQEPQLISKPFTKNPMVDEIREFKECIEAGLKEPKTLTYQRILDVHTVLTEARIQSGVIFHYDK